MIVGLPSPIIHHPFDYRLGPVGITGFGIAVLMSFLVAQVVAQQELVRRGDDPAPISDLVFVALVSGLIGAKLYYVVILHNWDAIFELGGFVFWGGFIAGALAVSAVIVRRGYGFMKMADVSAPALAAAYAVGRTGCWAIGDDYGRPWKGFLAVAFPSGAPPSTAGIMAREFGVPIPMGAVSSTVLSVYPTQLYEVALGLVMFGVLWRLRAHRHNIGWLFGLYCVLAGLERFVVEFFRAKDDRLVLALTYAQLIALAFVAVGAVWMLVRWRAPRGAAPTSPAIAPA